jgi:HAD superfamily hydrolase (TIGR01490 family)
MIGAFFDVVGTIYSGAFWRDISQYNREQKRNRFWVWAYLIWHMAGWPLNLAGLLSDKRWYAAWASHMPWMLRGFTIEEGQELFDWLTDERLIPNLRTDIMDILRDHQAKGHVVALVSGSPQELLDVIISRLGIEHALGTPLEVTDGHYTGKIAGPLTMAEGKIAALQDFVAKRRLDIDWEESFAYGDSRSDTDLLEIVGKPVAVYPDKVLKARALEKSWTIIGEREPRT